MKTPPKHPLEELRQRQLESYHILDTFPEDRYDNIVQMAAKITEAPIALITLIDKERQWFKSKCGLSVGETSRDDSFCGHAIINDKSHFVVEDATKDKRFFDNPLVTGPPHIVFYAGISFYSEEGLPMGTLCVIDHKPRKLSADQYWLLKKLSLTITSLLRLRKKEIIESNKNAELQAKNKSLEQFSYAAAHDLKSPLSNMVGLIELIRMDADSGDFDKVKSSLNILEDNSKNLKHLIDGLIEFSQKEQKVNVDAEPLNVKHLFKELKGYFDEEDVELIFESELDYLNTSKAIITQNLLNLISNAVKYNDKQNTRVKVNIYNDEAYYKIEVSDNGPGISDDMKNKVFDLFSVGSSFDRFGKKGSGIGLSTVQNNVLRLGGEISFETEKDKGTKFSYTVKK